ESKDDGNDEEDQDLQISEEERMQKEEEAGELYRYVDINQGRGLQVSQDIDDSHVTLTPIHSDGLESSSTSSFMTSLLDLIIDLGIESIFTTGSSSVTPIPSPKSTMTPSILTTTTTASQPPTPPTPITSDILQTLPTFTLVFHFEDRVKSLEVNFSEFMRTNQSPEAVSNISGLVHQYMHQEMTEAVREAVSSHSSRTSYAVAADLSEMELKKILIDKMEGNKSTTGTQSRQMSASESAFAKEPVQTTCQMEEPSHPVFETAAQGNAQSWISILAKQTDARSSFNELLDTPIDFSNFIMNRLGVDTLTPELLAGPTYELMRGSCNSLTELKYHLEEVYKATMDQLDWDNPERSTGIRMQYLPTTIWRKGDKDKATAMIQAIDKMLKTRRIMRSLESGIVTHWFTLIVLSALRRSDNENMLSLAILIILYSESLTYAGNHAKEILLKVNLSDHREVEIPDSSYTTNS
nr:hypothetical protein [Tanacetum cinerariifolium]